MGRYLTVRDENTADREPRISAFKRHQARPKRVSIDQFRGIILKCTHFSCGLVFEIPRPKSRHPCGIFGRVMN